MHYRNLLPLKSCLQGCAWWAFQLSAYRYSISDNLQNLGCQSCLCSGHNLLTVVRRYSNSTWHIFHPRQYFHNKLSKKPCRGRPAVGEGIHVNCFNCNCANHFLDLWPFWMGIHNDYIGRMYLQRDQQNTHGFKGHTMGAVVPLLGLPDGV